jgi:hypothetical protein
MEKEQILREIRRTAAENGGKSYGQQRFESETGIRRCDWDKHWARWGDALKEAGFEPNQWSTAYGDEELLEKLAQLARELGHLPVRAELAMKARGGSGFPSPTVFRRLGGKAEIVRRLHEYCVLHPEYNDVAQMCKDYAPPRWSVPEGNEDRDAQIGFVYLMKSGRFHKIGHSDAPGRRQYDLAIQLPEKIDLIHKIPTGAPEAAERFWHERFKAKRKGGEWFALSAMDVKTFKRCKSM